MKLSPSLSMTRQGVLALGLLITKVLLGQTDPHAAWQYTQALEVPGTGLMRLEVPPATLNASSPLLEDVRLVNPTGIETPYFIEWPQLESVQAKPVGAFRAALHEQNTVLELDTGTDLPIHAVTLVTAATSFIKAATLEGSNDAAQWQPIAANEVLFRQANGASRVRIPFNPAVWKHLRVTLNDTRSEPVAFTGANVELEKTSTPATAMTVTIQKREELHGHTRLTVPLGAAHLWLASIKIQAPEPVFSRRVNVLANDRVIASETLFRVALDGHETSALTLPILAQVSAAELVLDIENGDSPPLKIDGVEAARYPVKLAFHAGASGRWQLFTGNSTAAAVVYDMAALADQLRSASSVTLGVSALVPNPAFDKTATLPETGETGAAIDLQDWTFRKPVNLTEHGVIQAELDLETLAHASPSFADVRLVQGGRQLPYLLQQTTKARAAEVKMIAMPDAKRPTVSRWQLKLPLSGMPLTTLNAVSSTPLFSRYLSVSESLPPFSDNHPPILIGSAEWSQKPGTNSPWTLFLNRSVTGDTLFLETDNGDNAPLTIDKITVSYPVVRLLFKTTDTAPIELYYGNARASTPRYDLSLVTAELEAATPIAATLGAEKRLKAGPRTHESTGQGSPWLWAALALVVGGLLWIVARLLPQTEA